MPGSVVHTCALKLSWRLTLLLKHMVFKREWSLVSPGLVKKSQKRICSAINFSNTDVIFYSSFPFFEIFSLDKLSFNEQIALKLCISNLQLQNISGVYIFFAVKLRDRPRGLVLLRQSKQAHQH